MSAHSRLANATGRPAELFRALPNGKVQCTACARYCQIGEGQVGLCGVRGVVGGRLHLLVYGKVIAGHIDPIEKKPVVHYKPGSKIFSIATTGCNWLCHPKGAKILLADGRKKSVEGVIPGDMLWSYDVDGQMRIRPNVVTHTSSRQARIWAVRYGRDRKQTLFLTAEHPVLTPSGWKEARELRAGDKILKVWYQNTKAWERHQRASISKATFHCSRCGVAVSGVDDWNRHRGDCYTKGLTKSPEQIEAIRARMRQNNPMKDPVTASRAIRTSRERFLVDPNHGWHRNVEKLQRWLHERPSASQRALYGIMDELKVGYRKELKIVPAKRLASSKSYYLADVAIPEIRLDIESDGWWRRNNDEVRRQDAMRDRTLRANGWEVLRFSGSQITNHPNEVKGLIAECLEIPVMKNKREWMTVRGSAPTERVEEVYGLESVPDHNYVADGILVHNCAYCQNSDISQRRKAEGIDAAPEEIVEKAAAHGCEGLAYTYNQPTIFMEYARDVGRLARKRGIFNVFVSNGFDTPDTVSMSKDFLDCITVDFKGSGETSFVRRYIGIPNADPVFETLLDLKQRTRVHIEVTDLIIPTVGDNLESAERLCRWVYDRLGPDTPVHFLRFHPDYKMMDLPPTPVQTLEKHHAIGKKAGLNYVYIGNVPGHPAESTYCPGCGSVLVGRRSYEITEYNLDGQNRCKRCGCQTPIVGPLSKSSGEDRFLPVIS